MMRITNFDVSFENKTISKNKFIFSNKMSQNLILTTNYNVQKLSLGSVQDKKSRDGNKYRNVPILYDGKKARIRLSGRFQVKEYGDLSLVVQIDDDNRKLFEELEEKLRSLANEQSLAGKKDSLTLIKEDNFYLKIYTKPNGKINVKFWKLVERDGKEYRKPLHNPDNLIGKKFEGEAVFSLDNIFMGKTKKGESFPQSIISVAEEVLVRGIIEEHSYFEEENPVLEDSEDSEDDDNSVDSRDGVDEHTPPPWKRTKDLRLKM